VTSSHKGNILMRDEEDRATKFFLVDKKGMTCHSLFVNERCSMTNDKRACLGKGFAGIVFTLAAFVVLLSGEVRAQSPASGLSTSPALMVQIKCKPGTADQWQADFEKEIVPSIQEAIAKGDGFTGFSYYEAALPSQFDFVLVYESKSFSGLDVKRPFPHYAALYRRVGPARAQQILGEMGSWEQDTKITLVRAHHGQP
jgi:hypothetical protein